MTISVSFGPSTLALVNSANYFIAAAYDPSTATPTWIESVAPIKNGSAPWYTAPFQVTFTTNFTANKVYRIILLECASNQIISAPSGNNVASGDFPATQQSVTLRANLDLIVGTSPGLPAGQPKYTDPTNSLNGWVYSLFIDYAGPLQATEYTQDANNNPTITNGTTPQAGSKWSFIFQPKISLATPPAPSLISSGLLVTGALNLTASNINSAISIQGASSSFTVGLPELGSITDFSTIYLYSSGGSHINVKILCSGTDKILHQSKLSGGVNLLSYIVLGQNETAKLFRMTLGGNTYWYVDGELNGFDSVLQIMSSFYQSELNTHPFDGTPSLRSVYIRVWDKIQLLGTIVSDATWNNHTDENGFYDSKGFFSSGDGSTTFRWPYIQDFLRPVIPGAGRSGGSLQDLGIFPHVHPINTLNYGDAGTVGISQDGAPNNGISGGGTSGGGSYKVDATDPNTGAYPTAGENRPTNIGNYILAKI